MSPLTVASGSLAVLSAVTFVYPYVLYPLTLKVAPRKDVTKGTSGTDGAGFALFFSAYNEAKVMNEKLANLAELKARYPRLTVFAYDDGSTDGTREMLHSAPDLVTVIDGAGRTGKAHGMKAMVSQSGDAEYLIFTDANVILDVECIAALAQYYSDASVGGVCGSLKYVSSGQSTATEATGGLYWRLEEWTKSLESQSGNVMGADGSIFSVRRALYPDFPDTVQDDFTVSMSVVFARKRLVKAPEVIAYERLVAERSDEARRKVRISARAFHTHLHLRPGLRRMRPFDKYKYFAHKLLRWWGAAPIALCLVATATFLLSFGLPGLWILIGCLIIGCAARFAMPKVFNFAGDLLTAVFATFRGVLKARRGETFAVWTPPSSR